MDNFTLFAGSAVVFTVFAIAFAAAARRKQESFWQSWIAGNLVLTSALLFYMVETNLPDWAIVALPNGLLLAGFGLLWTAARQFNNRKAAWWAAAAPLMAFLALIAVPMIFRSYGAVYMIVNVLLAGLAFTVAYEFFRDRADGLQSRYALTAAYVMTGLSFAMRAGQGAMTGALMARQLPHDMILTVHLFLALIFSVGSGAFSLSIVFERTAARLRDAASRDTLTGLLNRGAFERQVTAWLSGPDRRKFSLAVFDLDHFKQINDTHGHEAGDRALKAFAACCRDVLRAQDAIARIGGEEFAVIMPETSRSQALALAERVRLNLGRTEVKASRGSFRMTVSAGICQSDAFGNDYDALMRAADRYLYAAKDAGRDQVQHQAA